MRSPVASLKEWWVNRSSKTTEAVPPPSSDEIRPNATFRHGTFCLKREGIRPCGCMPRYRNDNGTVREFWVTPHPNRRLRRQLASKAWQRAQRA